MDAYFFHFLQSYFICTFLFVFLRFSVILGQLLRCWHIVPIRKLNRVKNVLFAKKYGFSKFNSKYVFSVFNTKYGSTRTNTEFFSLKYGSPYIDLNRLEKTLDPYFLHFTQCYFICTFLKKNFRFSVFLGHLLRCVHIVPSPN